MTIDERLEFLVTSTESLQLSCQELHATVAEQGRKMEAQAAKERSLRRAMLQGFRAFLEGLEGDGGE